MNKLLLATALLSSTAAASVDDIAYQLQQEINSIHYEVQQISFSGVGPQQLQSSYRSNFETTSNYPSQIRINAAKRYIRNYENAVARTQRLIDMVENFPARTRDMIKGMSFYTNMLDRFDWYKGEIVKYKSLLNDVTEISRDVVRVDEDTTTELEPELTGTTSETVTETDDEFERTYEVTTNTYRTQINTITKRYTTTTIHYSEGTTKEDKQTEVTGAVVDYRESKETDKVLISEIALIVEPEPAPEPTPTPIEWNTAEYNNNWAMDVIKAEAAYQQGWTGKGVTVAVIDTGVDTDHPELLNLTDGYNFLNNTTDTDDDNFHGTHVAGTIAAARDGVGTHGVAFDATIMPIKILDATGNGTFTNAKKAVAYAAEQGVKVANLSLGKGLGYNVTQQTTGPYDHWFGDTYKQAVQSGTTLVIAAGNQGHSCKVEKSTYWKWEGDDVVNCNFPAALPYIPNYESLTTSEGGWITVGAVDSNNQHLYDSNKAGIMQDYYLVAPGGNILSTTPNGEYAAKSGTSMAAPHVTGAFALLTQKFPYLSGNDIADILFVSATDLGEEGTDDIYGRGLLNIEGAMRPIGELNIPLGNTTEGTVTALSSTTLAAPAGMSGALLQSQALKEAIILDEYERVYTVDMTDAITAVENTYSFDNYRTSNIGNFVLGISEIEIDGNNPIVMGYQLTDTTSMMVGQQDGTFGAVSGGALSFGDSSTIYTRLGWTNQYNGVHISANLDYGYSAGHGVDQGYITQVSDLHGLGFGAKMRMDNLTLALNSPISIESGSADLKVSNGRTMNGEITHNEETASLAGNREYRMNANYMHRIDREQSLSWDLNSTIKTESSFDSGMQVTYKLTF
ncbi:MAG: S8 family serine peptidase [Gammaproteobacteria bacterium]|nr:S8 family serine peptidase [Gammaproteobacteria bacterium]